MRWPVFWTCAFVMVALHLSLRSVFTVHVMKGITPDIVACLAVFVSLFAGRVSALWACWFLGLLMDLSPSEFGTEYHLIGRHALGYVFGGYLVLLLRTMVFRRHAVTMGFMTFLFIIASGIVSTFILMLRSDVMLSSSAIGELSRHVVIAAYSGLLAIGLGWLLSTTIPLWGFVMIQPRYSGIR